MTLDIRPVAAVAEIDNRDRVRQLGTVPALYGVRGVAVLLVVGRHYNTILPGGGLGVDLFFVLSGFLITSLLLGEHGRTGRISLGWFYWRRALRLLPALLALIAVYVSFTVWKGGFADDTHGLRNALWGLSYLSNFPLAAGMDGGSLSHLWSLAQEEQFYLLWPPLLTGLLALRFRPRPIVGALLAVAGLFAAHRWSIADTGTLRRLWVAPDMHADALIAGCAAGFVYCFRLWCRWLQPAGLVALAACVAVVATEARENRSLFGWPLAVFVVAAAVAVLAVADSPRSPLARLLSFRPLQLLGVISYGLYLWHFPIFKVAGATPLALVSSVVVAAASYRYLESPVLRLRQTRVMPQRRSAAAAEGVG